MSNHSCSVKSANQLIACQQCSQNQICCNACFKFKHINSDKTIHKSSKLFDADVYKNFLKIVHVEWLIGHKLLKSLGSLNFTDQNTKTYLSNAAFYGSEFFRQLFADQYAQEQFIIMKNLYMGTNQHSFQNLSALQKILNNVNTLDFIGKHIKKLTQLTQEEKIMNNHIDFYTGADIYYLQEFFVYEQQIFMEFYDLAVKQQREWTIYKYIEWREKKCEKERNPTYYSKEYTAFLVEFYRKNADQKGLYTLNDYIDNYWEFFNATINLNPIIKSYFDEEVKFYRIYENLMTQNNLFITHLGFKIWKLSNGVSKQLPYLKNHYFLFAFIQAYIRMLIQRTYTFLKSDQKQELAKQTWQDFVVYIKDYSLLIQELKQNKTQQTLTQTETLTQTKTKPQPREFDFQEYKNYYLYRRRLEPFHNKIKASKQNIYDQQIAIKFFNHYFLNPTQLKPKLYKQFFQKYQQNKKQQEQLQIKKMQALKEELKKQQNQSFYEFVYLNFVTYCKEQEISLKKETYYAFKKSVLENMDEKYIQQTQERFKRGDFNQIVNQEELNVERKVPQEGQKQTLIGQTGAKITIGMDQYQEEILQQRLHQDQQSQEDMQQLCPCCNGDVYKCGNPDCQIMGYCMTCSQF